MISTNSENIFIIFELMDKVMGDTETIRRGPGARRAASVTIARMWISCLIESTSLREPVEETEDEDETHFKGHMIHGAAAARPRRITQMRRTRTALLRAQRQRPNERLDAISPSLRRI